MVYDPDERADKCPDEDALFVRGIEIRASIPVFVTQDQLRRLHALLNEITRASWNQPLEGTHWVCSYGHKTHWSQADAALLGLEAEPGAPAAGEPTFDEDVYEIETYARPFLSGDERDEILRRRSGE